MKIKELITTIATQSGVLADSPALKSIIDNATLTLDVDDDLAKLLTAPRMTMEAARANPELKKHFKKEVYDGIQAEVKRTAAELGLDETAISEIDTQDTDFKKIGALAKKVQALTAAKAGAGSKDTEKLNKEIEKLNEQAASIRTEYEGKLKSVNEGFETERIGLSLNNILSGYDYATPVDKDINVQVARTLVDKGLAEKGIKIVRKDNDLTFVTSEGTEYFEKETNKKVTVKDFVNKTLANAKVLKTSGGTPAGGKEQKTIQRHVDIGNGGAAKGLNVSALEGLSEEN